MSKRRAATIDNNGHMRTISVSPKVVEFIKANRADYRLCTSCGGPILLPISIKRPKPDDIKISLGEYLLYVSAIQARFIECIDDTMLPFSG